MAKDRTPKSSQLEGLVKQELASEIRAWTYALVKSKDTFERQRILLDLIHRIRTEELTIDVLREVMKRVNVGPELELVQGRLLREKKNPFGKGYDPKRHVLTREEKQLGFQRALESIADRYLEAIVDRYGTHMSKYFYKFLQRKGRMNPALLLEDRKWGALMDKIADVSLPSRKPTRADYARWAGMPDPIGMFGGLGYREWKKLADSGVVI